MISTRFCIKCNSKFVYAEKCPNCGQKQSEPVIPAKKKPVEKKTAKKK